jgi:hypothetical protein
MKITISQTRQVRQYEPLKIEVTIDTNEDGVDTINWKYLAQEVKQTINELLYPENYPKQNKEDEEEKKKYIETIKASSNNDDDESDSIPF